MKTSLIRIGNSQGIKIPKTLIQQCGLTEVVEITVEENRLIITPIQSTRQGWEEAFKKMAENEDDRLLIDDGIENSWDEDNWKW